jgi:predicted ester cyclase
MSDQHRSAEVVHREPIGARDLVLLAVAAAGWLLMARLLLPREVHVAVIPTLTALTIRHFRHDNSGTDAGEPKHPAVKFILDAWNSGDFGDAQKFVAPDLAIEVNGYSYERDSEDDGPAMAQEGVEYWRAIAPDIKMELVREIREKDEIVIEWLITGTHTGGRAELPATGNAIELHGSAFLTLEDDKIVDVVTLFDGLALEVQTGAVEAPDWWPGRMPGVKG